MKHPTLIDGIHLDGAPRSQVIPPTLLRYDLGPELITSFFNDLERPDWTDRLQARAELETRKDLPLVDQAMHRKACIVVVDAACLTPGFPRVDPAKVESAGLVVRRERTGSTESWMTDSEGQALGWKPTPVSALPAETTFEPDAKRRRARLTRTNRALAGKTSLVGDEGGVSETTHPLFPIPPDKAEKIGRSLYFAVLPTTSMAVVPAEAPPPPFSLGDVGDRVPNLLKAARTGDPLPATATVISADEVKSAEGDRSENALVGLRSTLTWLGQEAGLFTGEPYADALRDELSAIAITGANQANLFAWLEFAQMVLVERRLEDGDAGPVDPAELTVLTPDDWPTITTAQFERIRNAGYDAMAARWSNLAPSVTRFGPIGDRYHVRCFLRLNDCQPCPPRVLWSPLSTSYTIRPWYESGGAPPQQIELPPLNAETLKNLKPDVAVKVPPEIQQFMDKLKLDGLLDGKADKNLKISLGMICGFSIPIITICAFIILQIFLSLLNIIFFWLPFVKICIPYPIIEQEEE